MSNEKKLFYTIGEVSDILQLKPYVLRYWETEFKKLNPQKSLTGQRTYRPKDIQVALTIKKLLYEDKYTIAGALQKLDELDAQHHLVAFMNEPMASEPETLVPKSLETPTQTSTLTAESAPKDPQKIRDLKTLVEATKKLLKKYNLS